MSLNERNSDPELVEKLQLGDIEAFDQIFEKYGGKLYGFALKYLKSREETEELVQDVMNFLKECSYRYGFLLFYCNPTQSSQNSQ